MVCDTDMILKKYRDNEKYGKYRIMSIKKPVFQGKMGVIPLHTNHHYIVNKSATLGKSRVLALFYNMLILF